MDNALVLKFRSKVRKWKENLTDLTKNNNLLKFREEKKATVRILTSSTELFRLLVVEQKVIPVKTLETRQQGAQLLKFLKQLRKNANFIQKQKGVNSLFVAIGVLTWNFRDDAADPITSPILLIPVKLKVKKKDEYELCPTDDIVSVNPVLVQKLKVDYGINLPEVAPDQLESYDQLLLSIQQNQEIVEQSQWKIEINSAFIGLFSRAKASMVKDLDYLEQDLQLFENNAILRGLAGDSTAYDLSKANILATIPKPKDLDRKVDPKNTFQVVEADSSQQVVIEAAKSGLSFVVQGPPGAGKSQTIANIITELIAQNKRVLLIAEKPGALEVVFDRLKKDCGLEELSLLFHAVGKKEFGKALESTRIKLAQRNTKQEQASLASQIGSSRAILNDYAESLHRKWNPIGKSAFDLYGELLELKRRNVPILKFSISDFYDWTQEDLRHIKESLRKLTTFDDFFRKGKKTLWIESRLKSFTVNDRASITTEIEGLRRGIKLALSLEQKLNQLLNLKTIKVESDLKVFCSLVDHLASASSAFAQGWAKGANTSRSQLNKFYEHLVEDSQTAQSDYEYLATRYGQNFFELDLSKKAFEFREFRGFLRVLNPRYRKAHRHLYSYLRVEHRSHYLVSLFFGYKTMNCALIRADRYQRIQSDFQSSEYLPRQFFEPFFDDGSQPHLPEIKEALEWMDCLEDKYKRIIRRDVAVGWLASKPFRQELGDLRRDLHTAYKAIHNGFSFLTDCFPDVEQLVSASKVCLSQTALTEIAHFLDQAENEIDVFRDWQSYQSCIADLEKYNLRGFLESLKSSRITTQFWYSSFEEQFNKQWLNHIYDCENILLQFNAQIHEERIQEFKELDTQQYDAARKELNQLHARRWEEWSEQPNSGDQISFLREGQSSRRTMEIRQFIQEAGELTSIIKPCWLMSPSTVSEYVAPTALHFDTVIFDEASQIRTEDAIAAIMRAKQVIVVGDSKQLPPTAFFSGLSFDDDDEEEQDVTYESFLAACGSFMKGFTLQWHYRSQDESLINFSNKEFYNSELVTFPNPVKQADRGVHFHPVKDGIYSRGDRKPKNLREAEEVARLALEHVRQGSRSLGIIAFSQSQADAIANAIQEQLAQLQAEEMSLTEFFQEDTDEYFLKPLENVQGDERDIILLSFGYGKDKDGKFLHNFGPLTKHGGERRLNVAITRAKQKLILVASIRSGDLDPDAGSNIPVLRRFFEFAEQNDSISSWRSDKEGNHTNSPLTEDIHRVLTEKGYDVRASVGASEYPIDLAVINPQRPEEFLLGIECDGLTYARFPTARDRDRLRRQVLEKLNWKIHRIWAKEWFENRDAEIHRLVTHIEELSSV